MSQEQRPRVSDDAATWLARMLRSDAASFQEAFESWLREDRTHGEAFERLRRQYDRSVVLAHSAGVLDIRHRRVWRRWFLPIGLGIGAIAGGLAAAALMLLSFSAAFTSLMEQASRSVPPSTIASATKASASRYEVASPVGDIRSVVLPDGSKVTLDTGATLVVAFNERSRFMTLAKGRARFEVVHESRPFVVAAGDGDVTAHGTIFDVEVLGPGKIHVALLRGAIAVRVRDARSNSLASRELTERQSADFDTAGFGSPVRPSPLQTGDWPSGVADTGAMPLSELLRQANRYTQTPIEVADPRLAGLQVSGRFRINRPDLLVQNLADLFGFSVDRSQTDRILLRKDIQANTKPS